MSERTPFTEATFVLCRLSEFYDLRRPKGSVDFEFLLFEWIGGDENKTGEQMVTMIEDAESMTTCDGNPLVPGFKDQCIQIAIMLTCCAYAIQALRAHKENDSCAWAYACEAVLWLGALNGAASRDSMGQPVPGDVESTPPPAVAPIAPIVPADARVAWRVVLFEKIVQIDNANGGRADVTQVIRWLRKLGGERIKDEGGRDELVWVDDSGMRQTVMKKTISNALKPARLSRLSSRFPV